jgi:hypothetical protein
MDALAKPAAEPSLHEPLYTPDGYSNPLRLTDPAAFNSRLYLVI